MKFARPQPRHVSYKRHRKQVATQIILPVVLFLVLMIGLVYVLGAAGVGDGADVSRLAAISTIWIVLPGMLAGLLLLGISVGLIYLLTLVLHFIPPYSRKAQDYAYRARGYARRAADLVVSPVIAIEAYLATLRAFVGGRLPHAPPIRPASARAGQGGLSKDRKRS